MKIRLFSFVLAFLLTICICGCNTQPDNASSVVEIVETQTIVQDSSGNIISSEDDAAESSDNIDSSIENTSTEDSSDENTSSEENDTSSQNTSSKNNIEIDYDTIVEVDICDDIVRGYLDSNDGYDQFFWLNTYTGGHYNFQNLSLDWVLDGSPTYTLYFSENADFSDALVVTTNSSKQLNNTILVPGKTYYWKVIGCITDNAIGGGKIKVKDAPVRWIYINGVSNVRDMGGWETESGKTVKYEMLYRGAQLNKKESDGTITQNIKSDGLESFNKLGIKTEFDLRLDTDVRASAEGTNLNYVSVANHTAYHNVFSKSNKDTVVSNYKTMFEYLSDSSNYPIYTHCQGGADRTGTYAFLLNGLLGVSYEDLTRDFELTSFSGNKRWRGEGKGETFTKDDTSHTTDTGQTISWGVLYNEMMAYGAENGCTTLSQSIEHWFVNYVGIPQSQIDSFKSIMLE